MAVDDLQAGLEVEEGADAGSPACTAPHISDPVALFAHLDASGRFHRDSPLGRIYHRGMISLRENVSADSLHVAVHGNHVKAHVDRISPLAAPSDRPSGYSARQALAHNLAGVAEDVVRLLRGRQGDHRCELNCAWTTGETGTAADPPAPVVSSSCVRLDARVAGSLDEGRLRSALRTASGDGAALDVVTCSTDAGLEEARHRLDGMTVLLDRPPMRVCLARHPGGDVLMLSLNHAAADGMGALGVLRCIAGNYSGDDGGALDFLAVSELPVGPHSTPVSAPTRWRRRSVQWLRDVVARPTTIAPDRATARDGHGWHRVCVPAAESERLQEQPLPQSRSDVLIAALHRAVGDWNAQHDASSRRISVLSHTDLRPPDWREATIGNFSVTARMSTSRRDRSTSEEVMEAIGAQASRNRSTRTGIALVAALQRAGLLSLWAKQSTIVLAPLTTNDHIDSSVLCNLGSLAPPSFGPQAGQVQELWVSAPARSPSMLCVGAATIAGRLHLTFRYPHDLLDAPAAARFAECYLRHLRAVIDVVQRAPAR
ncbi:MAG TPA: hypothetical protein VMY78_03840 [Solirubrobacteraceae bacterium]|nr:hypothetical protein [Solirubrobacteraceae bacterium]